MQVDLEFYREEITISSEPPVRLSYIDIAPDEPQHTIIIHYALRIAILPTVTILGLGIGSMLSGALFAEIVFSRPGIGKLLYEAVISRNYPIVMGAVLVTTGFFVLSTLFSDIVNALLDPRLRERRGN